MQIIVITWMLGLILTAADGAGSASEVSAKMLDQLENPVIVADYSNLN